MQVGYNRAVAGAIKKILRFTKAEHTVFSLPLLFSGAWIGAGHTWPKLSTMLWLLMAGAGARTLGMAANRILDRHIDARNPRTKNRELPTGALSLKAALGTAFVGLAMYEIACVMLGPLIVLLSPVPAIVLIGYSLLKRFTPLCHFGIGLAMGLAPLGAYTAVTLCLAPNLEIILIFLFSFFWISGFDIIYALLDTDFDKAHRVHSMPAALGPKGAEIVAAGCHITALSALVVLTATSRLGPFAHLFLVLSAAGFVLGHLPMIPAAVRFFPISTVAGITGALVPFF